MITLAHVFLRQATDANFVRECIAKIPFDCPWDWRTETLEQIQNGKLHCAEIISGDKKTGILVYAVIDENGARELFVSCVFCTETKPFAELSPIVDAIAAANQCQSIRFHTSRPGMVKVAENFGYKIAETIVRKKL